MKNWVKIGPPRKGFRGKGKMAAIEVPDISAIILIATPNGCADRDCERIRDTIVDAVNGTRKPPFGICNACKCWIDKNGCGCNPHDA